jgi:hypothetical protein
MGVKSGTRRAPEDGACKETSMAGVSGTWRIPTMKGHSLYAAMAALLALASTSAVHAAPPATPLSWTTVVNNGNYIPSATCNPAQPVVPPCRTFNSYNQPSVNVGGLVVFRARSRGGQGGGEPSHGVYIRDMRSGGPLQMVLDRDTLVPQPNNRDTLFREPPSFPRIDMYSDTIATRGGHAPVWAVTNDAGEILEQLGTNGIYADPYGSLITAASKLGAASGPFPYFGVPELPGTPFDVFPGAPAVTDGNLIVFKGNYTEGVVSRTGVYYRTLMPAPLVLPDGSQLQPAGGMQPSVLIANNRTTRIPGVRMVFGSVAPPSAANGMAVFAGFDNEDQPTRGGIYMAPLAGPNPPLKTLVGIRQHVPGQRISAYFNRLGEGVSFDGRFVAFWGAWGSETRTLVLPCPTDGNADLLAYCRATYPNGYTVQVPVNQGIFIVYARTGRLIAVATSPADFTDFLFWNFSGQVPGSQTEEGGEPARWRSAAFVAVSGLVDGKLTDDNFHVAFKARTGSVENGAYVNPVDGIYLRSGPTLSPITAVVQTGEAGTLIDPEAVDPDTGAILPVTAMGLERDGFRGNHLAITVSMATDAAGWAGIYLTNVPK